MSYELSGWLLRKRSDHYHHHKRFFSPAWVRRWFVLNFEKREVEEYSDTTKFELMSAHSFASIQSVRKHQFKPQKLSLFFREEEAADAPKPPLELKISSAEERDIWYEALLGAMRHGAAAAAQNSRTYQPQRGWGDLGGFRSAAASLEEEEEEPVAAATTPSSQLERVEEVFHTGPSPSSSSTQEQQAPIDSRTSSLLLPFEKRASDLPPSRTSNLSRQFPPRTSQNFFDAQHVFMGKARTIALSISRDHKESVRKKEQQPQEQHKVQARQVVVPVATHDDDEGAAAAQPLRPGTDNARSNKTSYAKTAAQIAMLSQVVESEFPGAAEDDARVRSIVDLMYKLVLDEVDYAIVLQGEAADRMYVVEEGEVGVYSQDFANRPPELEHCKRQGGCFGVHNVLYHQPAPFTVRTHTAHAVFWVLPRSKYLDLVTKQQKQLLARKAQALAHVWLLREYLEPADFDRVAEAMEFEQYRAGDAIASRGKLYVVLEGALMLKDQLLRRNDVYGEAALVGALVADQEKLVCHSETAEVISLSLRDVEEICGPIKLYIIKRFTKALFTEVEDFDLEFQRIMDRDKVSADRLTALVRQSTAGGGGGDAGDGDGEERVAEEPLTFDKAFTKPLMPELTLDKLKFVAQLGKGQFGVVHRAQHLETGREYAVKVLRGAVITLNGWETMVEQERDAMMELTNRLASPFLLHLYNYFGDFKNCYLVMELCTRGSLYEAQRAGAGFTLEHIRYYIASTVLGLDAMHSLQIIHRDVKPENSMLVDERGGMKLVDFGISKKALRTFSFCGTPDYMAPEMLISRGYGSGVDFWATGVMLFELVCGYAPFTDFEPAEIYEKTLAYADSRQLAFPAGANQTLPLLTEECRALILGLLHPSKNKRLGVKYPGLAGIQSHPFFAGFDWNALAWGEMTPPSPPASSSQTSATQAAAAAAGKEYDAQLHFSPDDITGWTLRF